MHMMSTTVSYLASLSLMSDRTLTFFFFFFNDTATTEIYTLSLHDALPISVRPVNISLRDGPTHHARTSMDEAAKKTVRSEEHTSELQSLAYLVCRLLLEKKKKKQKHRDTPRNDNSQHRVYSTDTRSNDTIM